MAVKLVTLKNKYGDIYHAETEIAKVVGLPEALAGKQATLTQAQLDAVNSGVTADAVAKIATNETNISNVQAVIPTLADKDFVNSSIQTMSAAPISYDAAGNPFPTKADLDSATTVYSGGVEKEPDEHDYATVLADEIHGGAQTRYVYAGGVWTFQYLVNDMPFTAAQNAAINSGITAQMVEDMGDFITEDEADVKYAGKTYVEGLGTVYIVENGADLSSFGDNDLIIELDA